VRGCAIEVTVDLRVRGEQVEQRTIVLDRLAAQVVHEVVRVFPADVLAETHHHRFGHHEPVRHVDVRTHARGVDLEPSSTDRVCFSAPATRQNASGSTIHSISHGPVERS